MAKHEPLVLRLRDLAAAAASATPASGRPLQQQQHNRDVCVPSTEIPWPAGGRQMQEEQKPNDQTCSQLTAEQFTSEVHVSVHQLQQLLKSPEASDTSDPPLNSIRVARLSRSLSRLVLHGRPARHARPEPDARVLDACAALAAYALSNRGVFRSGTYLAAWSGTLYGCLQCCTCCSEGEGATLTPSQPASSSPAHAWPSLNSSGGQTKHGGNGEGGVAQLAQQPGWVASLAAAQLACLRFVERAVLVLPEQLSPPATGAVEWLRDLDQKLPMSLSQMLWAIAKALPLWGAHGRSPPPMQALLTATNRLVALEAGLGMASAGARDWSQMMWACAKLARNVPSLGVCCHDIMDQGAWAVALKCMGHNVMGQDLTNSLWACAVLEQKGPGTQRLLSAASQTVRSSKRPAFIPQELSNLLYSFARLEAVDEAELLLPALTPDLLDALPHMSTQELANTLYALGSLGHANARPAHAAMQLLPSRLKPGEPQHMGNSLWGLGRLMEAEQRRGNDWSQFQRSIHPLLRTVVSIVRQGGMDTPGCIPQNWNHLVWGLASLSAYDASVFDAALAAMAKFSLPRPGLSPLPFDPINAYNSLWACATTAHYSPTSSAHQVTLLEAAVQPGNLEQLTAQHLSMLLYVTAVLLSPAARSEALMSPRGADPMATATVISWPSDSGSWRPGRGDACCLDDATDGAGGCGAVDAGGLRDRVDVAARALFQAAARLSPSDLTSAGRHQLALAHTEACDLGIWGGGLPAGPIRDAVVREAHTRSHRTQCMLAASTKFQKDVISYLSAAGCEVAAEVAVEGGLLQVDALVSRLPPLGGGAEPDAASRACRVIVECDGPWHYLIIPHDKLTGSTLMRNRLLRRRCEVLVLVPYRDWERLSGCSPSQHLVQLLHSLLGETPQPAAPEAGAPQGRGGTSLESLVEGPSATQCGQGRWERDSMLRGVHSLSLQGQIKDSNASQDVVGQCVDNDSSSWRGRGLHNSSAGCGESNIDGDNKGEVGGRGAPKVVQVVGKHVTAITPALPGKQAAHVGQDKPQASAWGGLVRQQVSENKEDVAAPNLPRCGVRLDAPSVEEVPVVDTGQTLLAGAQGVQIGCGHGVEPLTLALEGTALGGRASAPWSRWRTGCRGPGGGGSWKQ